MHFEETTKCWGRGNGLEEALRFFHTDVNEKKHMYCILVNAVSCKC